MRPNISTIAPIIYESGKGNTVFACTPSKARGLRSQLTSRGYRILGNGDSNAFKNYTQFETDLRWVDFIKKTPEAQGLPDDKVAELADKVGLFSNF